MFEGFPVAEIDRIVRKTMWSSVAVAVLSVAVAYSLDQPLVVPGVMIGLGLGLANSRVFRSTAARMTTAEGKLMRRPFGASVLVRLAVVSVVALGATWLVRPLGWGVICGLALYQLSMLMHSFRSVMAYQRQGWGAADA